MGEGVRQQVIGRSPERLSPKESLALAGQWMALEVYTPATLPLRRNQALGDSAEECVQQLVEQGLDPRRFEYLPVKPVE
jgi:hypothetical protein